MAHIAGASKDVHRQDDVVLYIDGLNFFDQDVNLCWATRLKRTGCGTCDVLLLGNLLIC
jgi:hypothetical protein